MNDGAGFADAPDIVLAAAEDVIRLWVMDATGTTDQVLPLK